MDVIRIWHQTNYTSNWTGSEIETKFWHFRWCISSTRKILLCLKHLGGKFCTNRTQQLFDRLMHNNHPDLTQPEWFLSCVIHFNSVGKYLLRFNINVTFNNNRLILMFYCARVQLVWNKPIVFKGFAQNLSWGRLCVFLATCCEISVKQNIPCNDI